MKFWIIVVLMSILLIIDLLIAYNNFKKTRKAWEFSCHILLLFLLTVILMYITSETFNL